MLTIFDYYTLFFASRHFPFSLLPRCCYLRCRRDGHIIARAMPLLYFSAMPPLPLIYFRRLRYLYAAALPDCCHYYLMSLDAMPPMPCMIRAMRATRYVMRRYYAVDAAMLDAMALP